MVSFAKRFIKQFFRKNFPLILFLNKVQKVYFVVIPNSFIKNDFVKRYKQINAQKRMRSNFSQS